MQQRTPAALALSAVMAATLVLCPRAEGALVLTVDLGSAGPFAVLAGAGITIAAPVNTLIAGDIGTFPTTSVTGQENAILTGTNQTGNVITEDAKESLVLAYTNAMLRTADFTYGDGTSLSGTLTGGVHHSAGSFIVDGVLTLDAGGNSDMVWIFQTVSTLGASNLSQVVLANGALAGNVFWQVGSSATLGADSSFVGSILADQSISFNTGTTLLGRALAIDGAVTMGSATITIPEPSSMLLSGAGMLGLMIGSRRRLDGAVKVREALMLPGHDR